MCGNGCGLASVAGFSTQNVSNRWKSYKKLLCFCYFFSPQLCQALLLATGRFINKQ